MTNPIVASGVAPSNPSAVVNARPVSTSMISKITAGLTAGVILAGALSFGIGGNQNQLPTASDVATTMSIEAPSNHAVPQSFFTLAGKSADGSLNVQAMLESWRDAGMDASKADRALSLVEQMAPVIYNGATASEATRQGLDQNIQVARATLESENRDVLNNLSAFKTVDVSPDQAAQWDDVIAKFAATSNDSGISMSTVSSIMRDALDQSGASHYKLSLSDMANTAAFSGSADRVLADMGASLDANINPAPPPLKMMNVAEWHAQKTASQSALRQDFQRPEGKRSLNG